MVMSPYQAARGSHNIRTDNKSFERVKELKYLGTTLTNHNSMRDEIRSRIKSGNFCCHSMQKFLSPSLLTKIVKVKIYSTIVLPVVIYGCENK